MAINKVIDRNNNTLLDLTNDTVKANKVLAGIQFHDNEGNIQIGTLQSNELDSLKYNFIDYDGELLYSFTDAEIDAMTELPVGANHTDENLTFQKWNCSLESLKSWNRARPDRPVVGANYITTDRKSYIYTTSYVNNGVLSFSKSGTLNSVDWGDGTVDTNTSHTYANPGEYTIVIDMAEGGYWYFGSQTVSTTTLKQWVTSIKLGNITNIYQQAFIKCGVCTSINIPDGVTSIGDSAFSGCNGLSAIVIPDSVTSTRQSVFSDCKGLKTISLPNSLTEIGDSSIGGTRSLRSIVIPDSVTTIAGYAFANSSLATIFIPDGVTSILSSMAGQCYNLKTVVIPNSVKSIAGQAFYNCSSLTSATIPDGVTSIGSQAFAYCECLISVTIPDSVTSIGSGAFQNSYIVSLDLSKQTKVISLSGSIGSFQQKNSQKILVPLNLLDAYKSASYWSNYASCMIGV